MINTSKVAFITGGARRIGRTISEFLHQQGFCIAIHYHTAADEAHSLAETLNKQRKNSCLLLQANLKDFNRYEKMIADILEKYGRLDVIINNASEFYPTPLSKTSLNDFDALFQINLKAPFFLAQAALTPLKENSGCIINITDIHAQKPLKKYSLYSMTKAGLKMMTESLSRELAPDIRVNAVAPGTILWPQDNINTAQKEKILQKTPLKKQGNPLDIATAVLFLINSNYITGQTIVVDGGRLLD